jgi:hypothetical protein
MIRGHRATTAVMALILVGLLGSGLIVFRATHPAARSYASATATGPYSGDAPFTVVQATAPTLPPSVISWMQGHQTFDAQEIWSSFSAREQQSLSQQGTTESALQDQLNQIKQQGVQFTEFIYSGGYHMPDGTAHYTIEVVYSQGGQVGILTYYFLVDANGKIATFVNLTPQPSQG